MLRALRIGEFAADRYEVAYRTMEGVVRRGFRTADGFVPINPAHMQIYARYDLMMGHKIASLYEELCERTATRGVLLFPAGP